MKVKKRVLSLLLLLCLVATFFPTTSVQAAVKLNKTKASIYVGKTCSLKVKGTSKLVRWSSNKPSVATVTSTGKVTGKKAGVAKITAKVSSKKYVCTVTVKKKAETNYNKKISYEAIETSKQLVAIFYNENKANVRLDVSVVFYDASGRMLSQDTDYVSCFQKGKHTVMTFNYPKTADYKIAEYSTYKITFTATAALSFYKSYVNKIQINSNKGASNDVIAECVNTGSKSISYMQFTNVYYKDGNIVGVSIANASNLMPGTSTMITLRQPYDADYNGLEYDKFKTYTDFAYTIS